MSPEKFLDDIIDPGLAFLAGLGGPAPTDDARRFLLAIALQESGPQLEARYQNSPSPTPAAARGFFQFERIGVLGVLTHRASRERAAAACRACTVVPEAAAVWRAIEGHDILACCFARLLLLTDPAPLSSDAQTGWDIYMRTWRPGKPHAQRWPGHFETAAATVAANPLADGEGSTGKGSSN